MSKRNFTVTDLARFLTTIIAILIANISLAQYHKLDSLNKVLKSIPLHDTSRISVLIALGEHSLPINFDSTELIAVEIEKASAENNHETGRWASAYLRGRVYWERFDYQKAAEYLEQALDIATEQNHELRQAIVTSLLASVYDSMGKPAESIQYSLGALALYKELGHKSGIAKQLNTLSYAYEASGDLEKAIQYAQQSLERWKEIGNASWVKAMIANLAALYRNNQEFDKAISYYESALEEEGKSIKSEPDYIGHALNGLGLCYLSLKDYNKAELYFQRALNTYEGFKDAHGILAVSKNLGKIRLSTNDPKSAILYFQKALSFKDTLQRYPNDKLLIDCYSGLSEAYERVGNFKASYEHGLLADRLDSTVTAKNNEAKLRSLISSFESESREHDLLIAQKEQQSLTLTKYALACGVCLLSLLISFFFLRYRKKKMTEALLRLQEQVRLQKEVQERELTEEQLHLEIEHKTNELETYSAHLIEKNELLEQLKLEIESIKLSAEGDVSKKLSRLLANIGMTQRSDKDWEKFREHFQKVHFGFFDNLKASFPDLNMSDLKLCALMKMDFDTNHIASLLDITPESTRMARRRLRKKLNLETDSEVREFLISFESKFSNQPSNVTFES